MMRMGNNYIHIVKRIILVLFLITLSVKGNAQRDLVTDAGIFLHNNNLDSAKALIEQAIIDTDYVNEPETWYLRGFIYKTIYNLNEKINMQSPSRMIALNSFKHSISIDTSASSVKETKKSIAYLLTTFFNNSVSCLDSVVHRNDTTSFKRALDLFDFYSMNLKLIDSSIQAAEKVSFLKRLAYAYDLTFVQNKNLVHYFNLADQTYKQVLAIDSNDVKTNFNIATLYYNQAVNLIQQVDYNLDLVALSDIQDNQIALFKASLPYMLKAYKLNSKNPETLKGLAGIYFSLGDKGTSDKYLDMIPK